MNPSPKHPMTGAGPALRIREAELRDHQAVVDIYNHYVVYSHVTFDVTPFSLAERSQWLSMFAPSGRYRMFVAEEGSIVGYACSTPFRPKEAYATSVETTVYIHPDHTGKGIGRHIYQSLLQVLEDEDVHRSYAVIALPNPPSVRLHEHLGFRRVATLDQAGRKFGRYWDVSWYERSLERAVPIQSVDTPAT